MVEHSPKILASGENATTTCGVQSSGCPRTGNGSLGHHHRTAPWEESSEQPAKHLESERHSIPL